MKKFIVKFVSFAVLVYVLAWGMDWLLCEGQERIGGYPQQSWAEIRKGGIDADVVVMGNSRGLEHFNPVVLDSVTGMSWYNLGMGGYSINVELMKYHCYRAHNAKPKYVVYQVDWITMGESTILHNHQGEQYFPLIYEASVRNELRRMGYTWKESCIPLYRWFGGQTHIKRSLSALGGKKYCEMPSYSGFIYDPGVWDVSNLQFSDSIETTMNPQMQSLFESYLQECNDENIEVILIYSPMYEKAYKLQKNNAEIDDYFQTLSKKYRLTYWNYNDGNPMWADSTMFNAGVHLSHKGTDVFSRMVGKKVEECVSKR